MVYLWSCGAVQYGFEWGNCRKGHEEEWASDLQNLFSLLIAWSRMIIFVFLKTQDSEDPGRSQTTSGKDI